MTRNSANPMRGQGLQREILRLALPSILANITVPLVGLADTAVAGHLGAEAAASIGAVSVGAMLFTLLYFNFGFLRTGTGGLTAQAYGRGDEAEEGLVLARGLVFASASALVLIALQWPFVKAALLVTAGSPEVEALAARYFYIRIWAAPATLSMMVFRGWFVGLQDAVSSMWTDLIVNGTNIAASILLSLGVGSFPGIGFPGIALGTVIAQYAGLAWCVLRAATRYRGIVAQVSAAALRRALARHARRDYLRLNADLFARGVCFTAIYVGYTLIAARLGDLLLACSSILMQLMMLFSYFTDGFAYAGEALTGRFIGAREPVLLRRSVRAVFVWSLGIALGFMGLYSVIGVPILRLLTSDGAVVAECSRFLPWLLAMPPLGCAAFTWDGIFLGATASRPIRNTMFWAMVAFFAVWAIGGLFIPAGGRAALHLLMGAYFAHLLVRTVGLSLDYPKYILIFA